MPGSQASAAQTESDINPASLAPTWREEKRGCPQPAAGSDLGHWNVLKVEMEMVTAVRDAGTSSLATRVSSPDVRQEWGMPAWGESGEHIGKIRARTSLY